ncbi:cell death activator CIDE-A-like protein [Camelus ferus]|nr:cell death activator CIDE-A-like protein [Camelus ferus]
MSLLLKPAPLQLPGLEARREPGITCWAPAPAGSLGGRQEVQGPCEPGDAPRAQRPHEGVWVVPQCPVGSRRLLSIPCSPGLCCDCSHTRVRVIGSSTLALCHLASGAADAYYQFGLHCWDLAAATVIIREAGGVVMDTSGGPLDLMSCRVVAAGTREVAMLVAQALQTINYGRDDERPLTFMGSQTKKVLLAPLKHPARPFRVSSHDRSSRRGLMAGSLGELLSKTLDALMITSRLVTLVLEEDGTVVDTEEFFQTLGDNTHFMALEKGQKWTPGGNCVPARQPPRRSGIARVTLDLYKLNPRDVVGCLNVKATMYEMYSVSYDIRCTGLKALLRSLLRVLSHAAQVTGQFLVYAGTYMLQVLADTEEQVVAGSRCRQGVTSG